MSGDVAFQALIDRIEASERETGSTIEDDIASLVIASEERELAEELAAELLDAVKARADRYPPEVAVAALMYAARFAALSFLAALESGAP